MVSELDKTSMEVALKTMNMNTQTPPLIGGISYGEQVTMGDLDAKLITVLGNPNDYDITLKVGETFKIDEIEFKINAVENNVFTGFNGVIVTNQATNKTILWADGSKGFNNILTTNNLPKLLLELGNDWMINDALGIGSGSIFPQLQNLRDFAESYGVQNINYGIGQSMMGVGMSALAFTEGFENIEFRTYSGCLSYDLLHTLEQTEGWGLNSKNGSNLQSFTNENEPLTILYEPVMRNNKIYMMDYTDKKGRKAHSAEAYLGKFNVETEQYEQYYHQILNFDESAYPAWQAQPRFTFSQSSSGSGNEIMLNFKIGTSNKELANTTSTIRTVLKSLNLDSKYTVVKDDVTYNVYDKNETIKKLQTTQFDLEKYNEWIRQNSSDDDTVFLDPSDIDNHIKLYAGNLKGINNSQIFDDSTGLIKGEYLNTDTIAPVGVNLPKSGKEETPVVKHYTTKPQMLSNEELLFRALKEGNLEDLKKVIPNADKNFLNVLRYIVAIPGNPLQNANINQVLNNMLFAPIINAFISGIKFNYPMAIDLDGDGIDTIDINKSQIYFDVDEDGFREQTGWISKKEAILAIDKNGNGIIDNQSEMFGSKDKTGFEELKELDTNGDGIINSNDTDFNKIRLWQDLNENGVTDEGELKTLSEAGIISINTNSTKVEELNNNNFITEKATINYADGSSKNLYDVATQYNDMYTVYGGEYILDMDMLDLPWLRGYGNSMDLQLAASQNDNLKALIKQMASMSSAVDIYNQFDNMMSMWLGENKTGEDMQKLVLSKLMRLDLENMSEFQANNIQNAYNELKEKLFVSFIAQTSIADKFDIAYDYKTDSIIYSDNTYQNIVENTTDSNIFIVSYSIAKVLANNGDLNVTRLANMITQLGYGTHIISYINSGLKFKNGDFEYVDKTKPLYAIGTDGNDVIIGSDNPDIIYGMDGDDIINGGPGDDFLSGGKGNDILIGGDGNDTLIGGEGDDTLEGGGGNDTYIYDGEGKDSVLDEKWANVLEQVWVQDNIYSDYHAVWKNGNKQLVDAGDDVIVFGKNISLEDLKIFRSGNNLVFELKNTTNKLTIKNWYATKEQRVETFRFTDGLILNAEQILNMKKDTAGNDTITGTNKSDFILSTTGNDNITGGKGNDIIVNQNGNTTYNFNPGDGQDIIRDYNGNDKLIVGSSSEDIIFQRFQGDLLIKFKNSKDCITVYNWFINDNNRIETIQMTDVTITSDTLMAYMTSPQGTEGQDILIGTDEDNIMFAYGGDDYIEGKGGNDILDGGAGKDIMKGGLGNDTYFVDNSGDLVIENKDEGIDLVKSSISYILSENVENLTLTGKKNINGIGNELDNIIIGNDGNNILNGVAGNNTLKGGKGNDTYIINSSNVNDTIIENVNEGTDTVKSSVTHTLAANIENLILTGKGNINGTGNGGDNSIEGNEGDNILSGGAGNDTLYGGGKGKDTLKGGTGNDTYIVDSSEVTVVENANEGTDTVISSINYALTANVENLKLEGSSGIRGTGNTLNNVITGNNQNNTFVGGKGNDTLKGGTGADIYIFNKGDGQDIIQENSPNSTAIDKIVFGAGITKNDVTFTRSGYDLIVAIKDTTDKITIKNSNLAFGSRIERFEFADGTYIDGNSLYTLTATASKQSLYSDVSYLNINSKASVVEREYYDEGGLKSETIYGTNAKISSKKIYDANGVLIQQNTYNTNGLITKEVKYKSANIIDTQREYTYNSSNRVSKVKNYIGTGVDNTEEYTYNSAGLKTKTVIYKGTTTTKVYEIKYTYNSANKLSTETKTRCATSVITDKTSYTYDSNGRITRKHYQTGYDKPEPKLSGMTYTWTLATKEDIKYSYDSSGRVTRELTYGSYSYPVSKKVGTVTYNYNERATRQTKQIDYTYDTSGRITRKKTTVGYSKPNPTTKGMEYTWTNREDENITYLYNSDGKVSKEVTNGAYSETVSKTVGGIKYTYGEWHMHKVKEIAYVYNTIGDITSKTTTVGYSKPNPTTKGMEYTWAYRTKEKLTYAYNSNHQLSSITTITGYTETVSKTVGGTKYTYGEWKTRNSGKVEYTYNEDCRITGEKVYKYHYNDKKVWTSYLVEQKTYKYDSEGRLILAQHFNNSKLVESIKYEYTTDANHYLTKQVIYKGVISNNKVTSYNKYQEVIINSYYNKLVGNASNNTLNGSNQSDNLQGGAGNDTLYGNAGNDVLNGGAGADLMVGGTGNDTYVVDNVNDIIVEHANQGNDTVQTTLDNYTLGTNLENLTLLGTGNLTGKGNAYNNVMKGNSGNNTLYGYAGNDVIDGGVGSDTMYGGVGDDAYYVDNTGDRVIENANEGNDTVISSINYTLAANVENLYLASTAGAINGTGNSLNNKIVGNDDNNILDGKSGKNTLIGGKGDDTYIINASNASDSIVENYGEGIDTIKSSITYSLANTYNVENLTLTGTDNINGIGNDMDNYIIGNSGNNILRGGEGNDTLDGRGGSDTLYGGKGNDKYIIDNVNAVVEELEDEGNDTVIASIDYTLTDNVENLEMAGTANLKAKGNDLNNIIKGNTGDNTFEGGKGNDTIYGNIGNDTYIFNRGDGVDTIYETGASKYKDVLKFGIGITVDDVQFTKEGKDLVVSIIDSEDKIIIKNSNVNTENRIEQFIFADGTTINSEDFYKANATRNYWNVSSEFAIGNNVQSSSSNRSVDRYGNPNAEYFYDENGNLMEEIQYTYNISKNQNIDENGNVNYKYNYEKLSNKISYTYDENNRLLTKEDASTLSYFTYGTRNGQYAQTEKVYNKENDLVETITKSYNEKGQLVEKEIVNEEARKNGERETYIIYTYDDAGKLTLEQVKKTIYNETGSAIIYNMSKTAYTYHENGDLNMADTTSWYRKYSHNRTYTSDQVVYKYNDIGQVSSEIYFTGYYDEFPQEDGTVTLDYVRYKDVVNYKYDGKELISKTTNSGYYNKTDKKWELHVSERHTYKYDTKTKLLIEDKVETGELVDGVWKTKLSEKYTYEYNKDCMITKKLVMDYTLNSSGIEFQRIENSYDDKTGKLILTNTYIQNKLSESVKYEYVYDKDGTLLSQKIYNGIVNNNSVTSYNFIKEVAINSYNNIIKGDGNNNVLYGGEQDDRLTSDSGNNILYGGLGNDILTGGDYGNVLIGGKGDDTYIVGFFDTILENENEGIDTVQVVYIDYELPDNVENLKLFGYDDNRVGKGNALDNEISGSNGNDTLYGYDGNDTLNGFRGSDKLYGGTGNDTYVFSSYQGYNNNDIVSDDSGNDRILFTNSVDKSNIAIYQDGNDLIIDYGSNLGSDRITIKNQTNADNTIEKIELSDGSYISNSDVNQIIQNMTAYAQNNAIEFTGIDSVKNNADLMNLVTSSWHS